MQSIPCKPAKLSYQTCPAITAVFLEYPELIKEPEKNLLLLPNMKPASDFKRFSENYIDFPFCAVQYKDDIHSF